MLNTAPHPSVTAASVEADGLSEADRWLILTVLTADPVELPTDVPDLRPLIEGLAGESGWRTGPPAPEGGEKERVPTDLSTRIASV